LTVCLEKGILFSHLGDIEMDKAQKKSGRPYSLSRKWEKAYKKNTHKKRRQEKY